MLYSRREIAPREVLSSRSLSLIGIPRLFHEAEIEDYTGDKDIKEIMERYVDNIHDMYEDCVNLTFLGNNGNGKTFLSSLLLKNAYRYNYSAKRIVFSSFLSLNFKKEKTELDILSIDNTHNVEFLVIDEIGKEVSLNSGANISLLEELLKYREEKALPTIICSNLTKDKLKEKYGETFYSLITQSMILTLPEGDVRNKNFKQRKGTKILYGEDDGE
jgi:DNA replication protein DnaC